MVIQAKQGNKMKRYEYGFITKDSNEIITVKGKGIKQAIKEFNAPFLTVVYINKRGKKITRKQNG